MICPYCLLLAICPVCTALADLEAGGQCEPADDEPDTPPSPSPDGPAEA